MSNNLEHVKEGEESTPQFNELTMEELEDFQQPSRSGITSSFVIENANRARVVHTVPDVRSNSFVSTDAESSVRSPRTNSWQIPPRRNLRSQPRSPRPDRNMVRTNFDVVEVNSGTSSSDSRINTIDNDERSEDQYVDDNNENPVNDASPDEIDREEAREYRSPRSNSQLYVRRRRNAIDNFSTGNVELHVSTTDVWEALVAIREARLRREREREFYPAVERRDWLPRSNNGVSVNIPRSSHTVVIIGDRTRVQNQNRQNLQTMYAIPRNHKIHQNTPRLTHYIEEPNVGSGYIKELCFSADGRLICSPFGYGVRLLAFSGDCTELSNCVPPINESVPLHELATNISHSDIVVSTKFSPRHCLLVSGCLSGKIVWHQPVV